MWSGTLSRSCPSSPRPSGPAGAASPEPATERPQAEALVEERARLRAARDFAGADSIRDRLKAAGWDVVDGPDGAELRSAGAGSAAEAAAASPERRVTAFTVVQGWAEDALRWLDSLLRHETGTDLEALLVVNSADPELRARLAARAGERVRILPLEPTGWAEAANAGLRQARSPVAVLFDPGTEMEGPVLEALCSALGDDRVAVAGPFGVRGQGTLKEFAPHPGPEVDAIEGYCLAFRREEALAAGGFDPRFRFYRIADFELSFRLRAQGRRRAVVVPALPVVRHAHRLWEDTAPEERERLSKRNLYRFLDRWRDRDDLLTG